MNAKIYIEVDGVKTEITKVIRKLIISCLYYQTSWMYHCAQMARVEFGEESKQYNKSFNDWFNVQSTFTNFSDGYIPIDYFLEGLRQK